MAGDSRVYHSTSKNDALLVFPDKDKVFGWMIVGIILMACGIVVTVVPQPNLSDVGAQIVGPLMTAIMAIGTIGCIVRLFSTEPALVIDHTGIFINSMLFRIGPIEWGEIAELSAYHVRFQNRLTIVVTDPRPILARQPFLRRVIFTLIKGNLMRSSRILTGDGMLPLSAYELLAEIREHYQHELLHYHIVIREQQRR